MVLLAKMQRNKDSILQKYLIVSSSQAITEPVFALNTFSGYCFLPQLSHHILIHIAIILFSFPWVLFLMKVQNCKLKVYEPGKFALWHYRKPDLENLGNLKSLAISHFVDPHISHFLVVKGHVRRHSSETQSRMRGSAFVF